MCRVVTMFLFLVLAVFMLLVYQLYAFLTKNLDYWKVRNVPHLKPKLFFGNFADYILMKTRASLITKEICEQFPNEPYVGIFYGTEPALVVKDPDMIKLILSKDFYYFNGREITEYANCEPVTKNIFFNGGDEWKVCRQNLSPIFTSAKLKIMFPLIKNCVKQLEDCISNEVKMSQMVDVKLLMMKYTMACIINCIFGLSANTLKKSDNLNPFLIIGEKIFDSSISGSAKLITRAMWPSIFYRFGFKLFNDKIVIFFNSLFNEAINERLIEGKSLKNNFIDFILNWKNETYITGDSVDSLKTNEKTIVTVQANDELLLSQCILFFGAGFETTSTTMSFLLFELAKNKTAQDRVIKEVDEYLARHDGDITHDIANELPYTEACLKETMRLHPVLGVITRDVWDDYVLPTGLRVKRGDRIHIPVEYLHMNPNYFQEPEEFRPERFIDGERKNIKPFTFLPFGEGPRICIGLRLAKMVIYPGLVTIFKNHRIEIGKNQPMELKLDPVSLVSHRPKDVKINFISRHS